MRMPLSNEQLRVFIYDRVIAHGVPPSCAEIGDAFGESAVSVGEQLAALRIGKTALVDPKSRELWMVGPFSAAPTSYRVSDGTTTWYANCAWDMFGVATLVGRPVRAEVRCLDCDEELSVTCDPASPPSEPYVVHFLLPARRWYEDIGFT